MSLINHKDKIVVLMNVEELDFLEEFEKQLDIIFGGNEAYSWDDILEAYICAREHHVFSCASL